MCINFTSSMLKNVLLITLCLLKSFTIFLLAKFYLIHENFPKSPTHWVLFSLTPTVYTVLFTQDSINYIVLWVREACKEMESRSSISGKKRIQRVFQNSSNPTSTPNFQFGLHFFPRLLLSKVSLRMVKTLSNTAYSWWNSASCLELESAIVLCMTSIELEMEFWPCPLLSQDYVSKVFVLCTDMGWEICLPSRTTATKLSVAPWFRREILKSDCSEKQISTSQRSPDYITTTVLPSPLLAVVITSVLWDIGQYIMTST